MNDTIMERYLEEVLINKGKWVHQTYPIDRGVKLMLPPDDIARALVHGGYCSNIKEAKSRVIRHLRTDTKEKRAQRCIVSTREYNDYLIKHKLPEPDDKKGYS